MVADKPGRPHLITPGGGVRPRGRDLPPPGGNSRRWCGMSGPLCMSTPGRELQPRGRAPAPCSDGKSCQTKMSPEAGFVPPRIVDTPGRTVEQLHYSRCWPSGLFEARGAKAKKPQILQKQMFLLALPPSAARPENHLFLDNVWFFALAPQASKKPLGPKKHLGIPLSSSWSCSRPSLPFPPSPARPPHTLVALSSSKSGGKRHLLSSNQTKEQKT
jgi:hypothetical protein